MKSKAEKNRKKVNNYFTYDWTKEYPYVCDVKKLTAFCRSHGYDGNIGQLISDVLDIGIRKGQFLRAKGMYTMYEAKTIARALNMPFWDFYDIFLSDMYVVEPSDVNFIKLNAENSFKNKLNGETCS